MSTKKETIDFIMNQIQTSGNVRSRKMFGEYAIYCNEKVVALVCDDQLFVKMNEASLKFLDKENASPPYPGAKGHLMVPEDKWEDSDWMSRLFLETEKLVVPSKKKK